MKNRKLLICTALLYGALFTHAAETHKADSIDIFTYSTADGTSGLRLATQDKENNWKTIGDLRLVGSDFGAWGSEKRMYNPVMYFDNDADTWHLIFDVTEDGEAGGYTYSPNLVNWSVQEYQVPEELLKRVPETAIRGTKLSSTIDGKAVNGTVMRVPRSTVDRLRAYRDYRRRLDSKYGERTAEDAWRFAGKDTIGMVLSIDYSNQKKISDKFIGIFFEDINYAADGGLYAELIQNRDFEYAPADRGGDPEWHAMKAWSLNDPAKGSVTIEDASPIHPNNPHYALLDVRKPGLALMNEGYDGITVKKGDRYNISLRVNADMPAKYSVELISAEGKVIGKALLSNSYAGKWNAISGQLTAKEDCSNARLAIRPMKKGIHRLDIISMMPVNTFNGHKNGLRADLAQALADLKPKFIRFPGGCVAHGDGIDNIYDWKGSIGALEERTGKRNLWGYHQTRGLGYHEYFVMCEDFGASPLPVLSAGVPCQNSSTHAHHSHGILTSKGQQCGIPMDEMDAYVQDILDLIEYANGDVSTTWGAKRAKAGHPEPFNLRMIGIGNEDLITEAFKERFLMIFNAIKDKYPDIEVVGTVGPFYEGADYDAGWEFARKNHIPVVDEHYYVSPGWLIHNGNFYDKYPRGGNETKVYLGEYASHLPGRASNLEAALSNALYLTNVERNADIVTMTSYAPLLAKKNHTQWRPDLIYFDNESIRLTPDYYVQKMYGNNSGTSYVTSTRTLSDNDEAIACRLGQSVVIDEETGDTILKLVNMTPMAIVTSTGLNADAELTLLTGAHNDESCSETHDKIVIDDIYIQPPYSFSVLRFSTKR